MRILSLPLIIGCAFFSGTMATFMSHFAGLSHLEAFSVGGISLILIIFILDMYVRSLQQEQLGGSLTQVQKLQEVIMTKLSALEAPASEACSQEIISEIKLLHGLVNHMMIQESKPSTSVLTSVSNPVPSQIIPSLPSVQGEILNDSSSETIELQNFTPEQLLKIIKEALEDDRIDMLMQPIVSLPQRKVRAFECYSRLRDEKGNVVTPKHYLKMADEKDFMRIIDNTLLFRCVQMVRRALKKDLSVKFFCNLSLTTLRDKMFLESFVEFLASNASLAPNLIFEVEYQAIHEEDPFTIAALKRLALQGCHFSVDHVPSLVGVDFDRLKKYAVQFLKVDIHLLLDVLQQQNAPLSVRAFKENASRNKMDVIVTKIEHEKDLLEILDYQFDYGQGYLFGKPRLNRS